MNAEEGTADNHVIRLEGYNAPPNNGMQRTRIQQVYYHRSIVRAADAGVMPTA